MLVASNESSVVIHTCGTCCLCGSAQTQAAYTAIVLHAAQQGFTANTLTHIVNGIYKGAGISGATSHSGRRTGLTNLAERGVGVRVLMALAGHSNMATTQRYIDLRPAMLKAAVELV